jgi:hypothetical protein
MADDLKDKNGGYGNPPKHSRFRKGQSGNPTGRPKCAASFKADLTAELNAMLTVTENGKSSTLSKQRALINSLINAAMTDPRAVNTLLALMRHFGVGAEDPPIETTVDEVDLEFLESHLAQERKKQKSSSSDSSGPQAKTTQSPNKKDE